MKLIKIWLSRELSGLYMLTAYKPIKCRVGMTDKKDFYPIPGEPLGARHWCADGVKLFFNVDIPIGDQVEVEVEVEVDLSRARVLAQKQGANKMKNAPHGRLLNWSPGFKTRKSSSLRQCLHLDYVNSVVHEVVDLRPNCSPVLDQGTIGSCSGNASASCFDYGLNQPLSSRLFIYFCERALEGDTHTDAGATTLADACKTLLDKGVCFESLWGYENSQVLICPTDSAFENASLRKIESFHELMDLQDMKACLAGGHPFMFGIPVYESFFNAHGGCIPMPNDYEILEGGHALCCVGYNDTNKSFIFKNSWGTKWGDQGYGYLPYDYMLDLGDDFYTIVKK